MIAAGPALTYKFVASHQDFTEAFLSGNLNIRIVRQELYRAAQLTPSINLTGRLLNIFHCKQLKIFNFD